MEMPGQSWFTPEKFAAALAAKSITQETINTQVTRVLTAMYRVGIMDTTQPTGSAAVNATSAKHAALAQHLAEQAATLLRNEAELLPLRRNANIAVIGAAADCNATAPTVPNWGWAPSVGCINSGGGSGSVAASRVTPILSAIRSHAAGKVSYSSGRDLDEAVRVAREAEVAVVVVGTTSGESSDRNGTSLPADQLAYLKAATAAQKKTVVVVMTPGAMTMDWAEAVGAIVCFFMPGQGQGESVARVLYGDVNPSGKTCEPASTSPSMLAPGLWSP
jgi:beta-glucosidase